MKQIYKNAIGVDIFVDVGKDVNAATVMRYHVKKPVSGTEVIWTASKYDDTTLVYKTVEGDLDEAGRYILHAYVEWGATSHHLGDITTFTIYEKYRI